MIKSKDVKILALTTHLYKLERKKLLSLQQFKEEGKQKPIPAPTLKEGNPKIVMLREYPTLNTGASRNQTTRLLDMSKNSGGDLIIVGKVHLMAYT